MNILFITLLDIRSAEEHNIYSDLIREFAKEGHSVTIVSSAERRCGMPTGFLEPSIDDRVRILKVKTGNVQKTNIIEKGISTLLLEYQMQASIRKCLQDVRFDLVIYSTPPITLVKPLEYIKKRDKAHTYLLLKDIFPQNAVDIGMMRKSGVMGLLYRHFRRKEKKLYQISDRIGCMSQANVDYVLRHNPEVSPEKVEVCPNSIELQDLSVTAQERTQLREKYGIPLDKKVFVYGGNLGKPQGIPFLIDCLKAQETNTEAFFLIVGDGTEYSRLQAYIDDVKPCNVKLLKRLPKEDYDRLVAACDVGMIFLDHRFTIPNFPSRLLSYMQAGLPVLACTDPNTDIGQVITDGGFGWWCESNDTEAFEQAVAEALNADYAAIKGNELDYLQAHYTVSRGYEIIMKFC